MWSHKHVSRSLLSLAAAVCIGASVERDAFSGPAGGGDAAPGECRDAAAETPVPEVSPVWWSTACANIARAEYDVTPVADGAEAPNRAQNLRARFQPDGLEIVPRKPADPAWRFGWRTAGWGRGHALRNVVAVAPAFEGPRVEYVRGELIEWYENSSRGVEQGFTIGERPGGPGPLRIEGTIDSALRAEIDPDRSAIDFFAGATGEHVLRYGGLKAWDAAGHDLRAHLALAGDRIAVVVDDSGAEYPITIDPILDSPGWTVAETAESDFGVSVRTAGDVNGDGYSDVLVGAKLYDAGEAEEGRAFLYLGSAGGLPATPDWTFDGDQVSAFSGFWVGPAGDVNGDGYADVLVGAFGYDDGDSTDAGRAVLFHGSPSGLSSTPDWAQYGELSGASFGYAVGTAGDVNGDGFDDVVVTALYHDPGGRAYLYLGSSAGLASSPSWTGQSPSGTGYGVSAGTAGDVNADGYADVIVGCYLCAIGPGETDEGRAFVYHGSADGLSTAPQWITDGNQADAHFGRSVATAGDVNGDGYSDVVVGAPRYDGSQPNEGRVFVYLGSASGLALGASTTFDGDWPNANLGRAVDTAGDVNGDGFSDVIAGAPNFDFDQTNGIAMVLRGNATGSLDMMWYGFSLEPGARYGEAVGTTGDVDGDGFSEVIVGARGVAKAFVYAGFGSTVSAEADSLVRPSKPEPQAPFGRVVADAGDVNGDGYSDVVVVVSRELASVGRAHVYYGGAAGILPDAAWTATGTEQFGRSAAGAGDVNGDGYADVIVGAPGHQYVNGDVGRAYVYHGSPAGIFFKPAWSAETGQADDSFGWSVSTAGDVNGDGFSDVIVGAHNGSDPDSLPGGAFVYHGSASGLESSPAWSVDGSMSVPGLGYAVDTAGDVNGDGYSDVIVNAPFSTGDLTTEGLVFVYLGSADGLSTIASWQTEGNQEASYYGFSVGTAGDVDADGYSDVIVGAPRYTNDQSREGRAFVFRGSPDGLLGSPSWTVESNQPESNLGWSVSTAGDVNGDGFSDVIVGVPFYTSGQGWEGRAVVYHGSETGLASTHAWADESNEYQAEFGWSVSTAGDVNGDGFSDVIVGAPYYDRHGTWGGAFVYAGNDGHGLDRRPRQFQPDESSPIAPLGASDYVSWFVAGLTGRSPGGRDAVRLEVEVKPLGVPFTGTNLIIGPEADTGTNGVELSQLATGLFSGNAYRWRVRSVSDSPFFPRSPWFSIPGNAPTETDVRMAAVVAVENADASVGGGPRLAAPRPNPFRAGTEIAFTLDRAGDVRLAVYDVTGRSVAHLAEGQHQAGRHAVQWDGSVARGSRAAAGIYFLRLQVGSGTETRKVVLVD